MKLARVCADLTNRVAALHQMPYLERGILSNARSKLYKDFGDSSIPHINKRNHRYIFQWRLFIELTVNKQQNDFGCLVPLFQFERIGKDPTFGQRWPLSHRDDRAVYFACKVPNNSIISCMV